MPADHSPAEFIARGVSLADAPDMLRVLEAAFPLWPAIELTGSKLDHLEWKLSAPWVKPNAHTAIFRGEELVAALIVWGAPAVLNSAPQLVGMVVDLAVHADYQRQGLSRLLLQSLPANPEFNSAIGMDLISRSDAVRHMAATGTSQSIERSLQAWTRPIGLRASLAMLRRGGRSHLRASLRRAAAAPGSAPAPPPGVAIEEVERFDDRADTLWRAAAAPFAFARHRDAAYLNWRHADARSGARTIFAATAGQQLLGWAVLRPDRDRRVLRVADLLVHPEHPEVGAALLAHCAQEASGRDARALLTWLPEGHPAEQLLRSGGFVRSGEPFACRFQVRPLLGQSLALIESLADPGVSVHVTMADFDFS